TGGEQKVTVQHVSVNDGGQAIVGDVVQAPRPGNPRLPTNPKDALIDARRPPMPLLGDIKGQAVSRHRMTNHHTRNTGPMSASRRCGAKTRSGKACMSPAVSGKSRCRMHGGAAGSGAPRGNKNALKHGRFAGEAFAERRLVRSLLQESRALISKIS